ncbi:MULTISPECIES: hypothetical protein [unclassified Streptomyces]|uniref:hypothetical protein n=1 Tax=unclassified Streptomyces TaxID=2593676 RepID=UPI00381AD5C9
MSQPAEKAGSLRRPSGERRRLARRILDTPLPQLVDELDVLLHESCITDDGFFGAAIDSGDGRLVLSMPVGRSDLERDAIARSLLSHLFDAGLDHLPDPFVTIKDGDREVRVQLTDSGLSEGV